MRASAAVRPVRLYATTVDAGGRTHSEGPYRFATTDEAVAWVRREAARRTVTGAQVFDGDDLVGEVGSPA